LNTREDTFKKRLLGGVYGRTIRIRSFEINLLFSATRHSNCFDRDNVVNAQSFYGSIVGVATDPSGAVVADATVKATQTETNDTRTATTDGSGVYILSTVPAGAYVVSISKIGLDLFEEKNVELTINTTARVDAKLAIGRQSPGTIEVLASTAELEADRVDVHVS
jgi:hypothetical protein